MGNNSRLLKTLGIAAGGLGSVSINNNVAFTYLKHLGICIVQVANSVKCKLFLLYRTSVCFASAPGYLEATEHVI
jgi:hypothetical protein